MTEIRSSASKGSHVIAVAEASIRIRRRPPRLRVVESRWPVPRWLRQGLPESRRRSAPLRRSGCEHAESQIDADAVVPVGVGDADARGVVVALTDAGVERLTETAPVHLRGVSELFVAQLDNQELAVLKNALDKVTVDCTFG
jgi:hypothetical protein